MTAQALHAKRPIAGAAPTHGPSDEAATAPGAGSRNRIAWIDYAKGLCIILVVQLHVAVAIEQDIVGGGAGLFGQNWQTEHWGVWFAAAWEPFRMPLFFLVAGLFLARSIETPWRDYLDRKGLHFAYFYILWLTITFVLKAGAISGGDFGVWLERYLLAYIDPFGPLWFIYLLGVFFIVTRLLSSVPLSLLWIAAALLHIPHLETGSKLIDEFTSRYVFFVTGYIVSARILVWADAAPRSIGTLAVGSLILAGLTATAFVFDALAWPGVTLGLGLGGCAMLIGWLAIAARHNLAPWLAFCGRHSIIIYLAAFIPAGAARSIGIKVLPAGDATTLTLQVGVVVSGVLGALILWQIATRVGLSFLFERPAWARLPASDIKTSTNAGATQRGLLADPVGDDPGERGVLI